MYSMINAYIKIFFKETSSHTTCLNLNDKVGETREN